MSLEIPPAVLWLAAALLLPLFAKSWRPAVMVAAPLLGLAVISLLPDGARLGFEYARYELVFLQVDGLARMFGIAFSIVGVAAGVYAWHVRNLTQQQAMLLYAGGGIGVVFAGDFLTLLLFWEVMAVASTLIVWSGRTEKASRAGYRYLMYHVVGGGVLLAGIAVHAATTGDLSVGAFSASLKTTGPVLILVGVLVNTAMPPFHTWLPDSYPKATVAGSVFLSAYTTKTAVYVLARCFPGWEILFIGGVIMALYGVWYAMISNDIRQILSYHIISQVGYMVAAIGLGGEFAINGASAYAYNHLLYKALMFMGAGAVLYSVGETRLTHLGGLGRKMPWVVLLYLVGAASISGIPLFNGFVSKAMVMELASDHKVGYYILLLVSVGTFLSVGLKLPYFAWFYRDAGLKLQRPVPPTMIGGMAILATLCVLFGIFPQLQYTHLPFAESFNAYYVPAVVKGLQLPIAAFVVFWMARKIMFGPAKMVIDLDWFYRKAAPGLRVVAVDGVSVVFAAAAGMVERITAGATAFARNPGLLARRRGAQYDPDRDRISLGASLTWTLLTIVVVWLIIAL